MYQLNYLSILLILLAFFIFYNEFNKKLSIADMCLLAIAFIAILRASYIYIRIDNSLSLKGQNKYEGFVNTRNKSKSKRIHNTNDNDNDNDENKSKEKNLITLNSEESNEYFDIENDKRNSTLNGNLNNNSNDNYNDNNNLINRDAVNNIDALLGIGIHNKEMFSDIPESKDDIKSIFSPKIVIGKNENDNSMDKWNSVFSGDEFDTSSNRKKNRKRDDDDDEEDYSDPTGNRGGNGGYSRYDDNSNGDKCDGGYGVGNGNSYSYSRSNSDNDIATYTDKKKCGKYNSSRDDIRENEDGSLVVQNYKDAKTWHPGYTYLPPSNWNVPQKYPPPCMAPSPDSIKLTGLVDRGLPMNVLELHPYDGKIAKTEDSVHLTNVGSMLPKFKYEEQPFSKPYI
jgi:hypothetical protein